MVANGADAMIMTKDVTIKQMATLLNETEGTVTGWVSRKREFPVHNEAARGRKHYSKQTFTKLCLFAYATRSMPNVRIRGERAHEVLGATPIPDAWRVFLQGDQAYLALFA